jgi:hypothetical protein
MYQNQSTHTPDVFQPTPEAGRQEVDPFDINPKTGVEFMLEEIIGSGLDEPFHDPFKDESFLLPLSEATYYD